ncbi:uncharacterized protein LOC110429449 [Herrania umbratica]|uniref:Uncharacterized protein LOC110429449 n=1 Tax=Herrania umbratica TaxID=108875 RepID=A0A6J1BPI3_9ROSI|nr:uncharacterized protein LOC110429449 [Herrania umbratica]
MLTERLAKWALLLQEFDITYISQKAVKGQALVDFLADHPILDNWEFSEDFSDEDVLYIEIPNPWELYFDGAAQQDEAGAGVIFITPEGEVLPCAFTLIENCSNNVAEYQALIMVKKPELLPYVNYVKKLLKWFDKASIEHVPRKENRQADSLANLASAIALPSTELKVPLCKRWILPPITLVEEVDVKSNVVSILEVGKEDWRQPLINYLQHGKFSNDPRYKTEIKRRAPRFIYFKERQIPSLRIAIEEGLSNEDNIRLRFEELEALDEKRLEAQQRLECYQARLSKAFNKKVKPQSFQVGDLVLAVRRPINTTHRMGNKFLSKWDGPYVVQEVYTHGAYKIVDQDGVRVGPINGRFLKRYYA